MKQVIEQKPCRATKLAVCAVLSASMAFAAVNPCPHEKAAPITEVHDYGACPDVNCEYVEYFLDAEAYNADCIPSGLSTYCDAVYGPDTVETTRTVIECAWNETIQGWGCLGDETVTHSTIDLEGTETFDCGS